MAEDTLNGGAPAPEVNDSTGNVTPEVQGIEGTDQEVQPALAETPPEKMLSQSEVNGIAQKAKKQGEAKGRREALNDFTMTPPADYAYSTPPPASTTTSQSYGENPQYSGNDIQHAFQQQMGQYQQQILQKEKARQDMNVANELSAKMQSPDVKERYPDFDEKVASLQLENGKANGLIYSTYGLDNAADVLYELANNKVKAAQINNLMTTNPNWAQEEVNKLSKSIKANQQAADAPKPQAPLSQVNPSNVGRDDGAMSVDDFRNLYAGNR